MSLPQALFTTMLMPPWKTWRMLTQIYKLSWKAATTTSAVPAWTLRSMSPTRSSRTQRSTAMSMAGPAPEMPTFGFRSAPTAWLMPVRTMSRSATSLSLGWQARTHCLKEPSTRRPTAYRPDYTDWRSMPWPSIRTAQTPTQKMLSPAFISSLQARMATSSNHCPSRLPTVSPSTGH